MNDIKVSICIPAYQQPEYLKRALLSIFEQTYNDYEVIISDDSPDDSVLDVVKEFDDKRIKYFKNDEIKGSPENWNVCIDNATGEYIKILHHDDWFTEKDSLFKFVKMLDDNPDTDLAFSASANCRQDTKLKNIFCTPIIKLHKLRQNPMFLFTGNIIGSPSATIYRRKINKKFDKNLKWVVDIDFYLNILLDNPEIVFCKEPLISVLTESENRVTSFCRYNKSVELPEYIYLYSKYIKMMNFAQTRFICRLLYIYKIKSEKELKDLGIKIPKNILFYIMMFLNRAIKMS